MFEGSYPLTLDVKGRLSIPAELRKQLEPICGSELTITRHFGPFLRIYPRPEWYRVREYMEQHFTMGQEGTRRLIIGSADPVTIDSGGRILISPILRKATNLDKRVVLVGDLTRFELWDEEVLARYLDDLASAGMPPELSNVRGI